RRQPAAASTRRSPRPHRSLPAPRARPRATHPAGPPCPSSALQKLAYAIVAATIVRMDTAVKPQGCTNLKLRQLMRRVAQLYDAEVGKTGLRGTQYSLVSYVVKLGPVGPVDLARGMKLEASTLTRHLQPLVDAGLLV